MALIIQTSGPPVECSTLWVPNAAFTVTDGAAQVGPGPTYYPVSLGDTIVLVDGAGIPVPIGVFLWGFPGGAANSAATLVTTFQDAFGSGGHGEDSTKMIPCLVANFLHATIADLGDGLVKVVLNFGQ